MAEHRVLLITTRDLMPLAKSLTSMLSSEQIYCSVVIDNDELGPQLDTPDAVIIWAPASLAYTLFKTSRTLFSDASIKFLTVLPTFEPATFETDSDYPNEAYLRGDVSPTSVVLRLRQMLGQDIAQPTINEPPQVTPRSIKPPTAKKASTWGKVITVFSAKGGVGKTAISTNLAVDIKMGRDKEVLLIDGDLQFGDVAVWLGLAQRGSITELLTRGTDLDEIAIRNAIQSHESGLDVLLPPVNPATAERVKPEAVRSLVGRLQLMYDFIIIDTHVSYNDETLAMLDVADVLVLIVTPEIAVLRNTQIFLDLCQMLGYSEKIYVVLNRANTGVQINNVPENIRKLVKAEVVSDGRSVVWSMNTGKPFVESNSSLPVSQGINILANLVAGPPTKNLKGGKSFHLWPFGNKGNKGNKRSSVADKMSES